MPLAPGATFERYRIEALVGRGGMGEVYKALDTRLHRAVALKVLRSDKDPNDATTSGGVHRLLREARAAAAFNHPNSVSIYELGEAEGIPYIAMEFVVGSSLRAFIGDRTVTLDVKVGWLVDVARALWAAHKAGLVHRDVKPGNIMVSEEGVVKVLDFGLAKPVKKGDPGGFQTLMGQVLGTPRYMAPEQLEGTPADARSDQFAFGVVAYELVSGLYPGGPLAGAPQPIEEVDRAVTPELSRNIVRMMARDPAARFPTMEDAAIALRDCVPSLRNIKVPPSGDQLKRRKTTSDAPTKEQHLEPQQIDQSGAVSIDVPLVEANDKGTTQPIPAAVGAEVSRRVTAIAASSRAGMMKTLPLAQQSPVRSTPSGPISPISPPIGSAGPPSPVAFPSGVVSGVVHVPQHPTPPEPHRVTSLATPASAIAPQISAPIVAPRPPQPKSNAWIVVLIVVVLLVVAGGATFVLMHR